MVVGDVVVVHAATLDHDLLVVVMTPSVMVLEVTSFHITFNFFIRVIRIAVLLFFLGSVLTIISVECHLMMPFVAWASTVFVSIIRVRGCLIKLEVVLFVLDLNNLLGGLGLLIVRSLRLLLFNHGFVC